MKNMKKAFLVACVATSSVLVMSQAQAIDYCRVLLCMSHPEMSYQNIPECVNEVSAAFSWAKLRGEWGKCDTSGDDTQVKVNDWSQEHNKYGDFISNHGTANVYNNGELKKQYPF